MSALSASRFRPAFVVPRYGEGVVGGAEDLARRTAEELARRGHDVTALTTCAIDHHTWRDHYQPGVTSLNGVRVTRFPAETRLGEPRLHDILARISSGDPVSEKDQERWLEGVVTSRGLLDHLREHGEEHSHLIFLPYLFGTTYFGSRIHPALSYIIPCLHDEPFAYQSLIKSMLDGVEGLMFNSPGERRLASRILVKEDPGPVVGMGFTRKKGDPYAFRNRTPVRGDFVLYAGRREEGKNTPLLIEYFARFSSENPGRLSLVLLGSGEVSIPPGYASVIHDLGRVGEQHKWDCYSAARVFCQPSVNESLSIVLLEAWLSELPALVNSNCEVTSEHVRRCGGGLVFGDYAEFAEALTILLEDAERAGLIGTAGRRYVEEEYNWDSVIKRLFEALDVEGP